MRIAAFLLPLGLVLAGGVTADVQRYYARTTSRGEMVLVGVTVQRGDGPVTFDATRAIGASVIHFRSPDAVNLVVPGGSVPPTGAERQRLLGDGRLNSGLINPGGQADLPVAEPILQGPDATPGLAIEFDREVVNLPGDDVVLFELHRSLNSPPGGDAFHVCPLPWRPDLRSLAVESFDFPCDDPRALPLAGFDLYRGDAPPKGLAAVLATNLQRTNGAPLVDFQVLAVGIDLADLGYAEGESVSRLFLQDRDGSGLLIDPVLIVGLPAPEPTNLLQEIPEDALSGPQPGDLLQEMLEGPLAEVREIVFAERIGGFDHWYANFGFYAASVPEYPPQRGLEGEVIPACFRDGGRLCRLGLRSGQRTVLLEDLKGGVRDPQVHYDGQKILFSYRPGGQSRFHLYEISVDGTGLKQLTDGPWDDIEPAYLPDGGIVFCSSRCQRYVNCYRTPVATLYRAAGDGNGVRMLSTNIEHDNTPWVLPDGRVIYMRWEYVDRSQFSFHHLWSTNPDGTGQMVFFGNQFPDTAMLDAKPIPGTNRVVASFSPGHGRPGHMGYITVIDPGSGPDNRAAARQISRPGRFYRDPYAVTDACFLVADDGGIHVMDDQGNTDLVYNVPSGGPTLTCHEPRPLRARPRETVIASRICAHEPTGRLILSNIYEGRNMEGVQPGEIDRLLVLEQLPKPISFSGGMWPISAGGTFTLSRILGTVPVAPDGSASFEVPALRSLFVVALDRQDRAVKRMQSFLTVQPGETTGCVGCHEQRLRPPLVQTGLTNLLARAPSRIQPIDDIPDVLDFPRDVQPILDRHCVRCHNPDREEGRLDLSGDHTPLFSAAYWAIISRGLITDGRNEKYGNRPPRTIGSSCSPLLDYLAGDHYDVRLSPIELRTVQLWIDTSAVYAGTYAALGSGMHPVEFPIDVLERRCGACHGSEPTGKRIGAGLYFRFGSQGPALPLVHSFTDLQQIRGSIGYYKFGNARPPQSLCNLTRPDKSLLLRAPLSRDAGGLQRCSSPVFGDTRDLDYQTILTRIGDAAELHQREKRFDMPGFQPNTYYVGKLQEYGVLPLELNGPVDVYAADRAYWRSFWYRSAD
jgi:hypothetical protein